MELRRIVSTLVAAAILVLLLAQRHLVFALFLVAIPLLPWLLYSLYVIAAKPERRAVQASKAAIWIAAVSAVVGIHCYRHITTQQRVDQVAQAVRKYTATHGQCPADLAAAGVSPAYIKNNSDHVFYSCKDGEVFLDYLSTFVPFETESYDFKNGVWNHVYD